MIALAGSLAADIMVAIDHEEPHRVEEDHAMLDIVIATAVLNSVEMRKIKSTLNRMAAILGHDAVSDWHDSPAETAARRKNALVNYGLPDSVIEWALS